MARRKRRSSGSKRRRSGTMRSVRSASGNSVSRKSWRASGYRRNPRRGRKRYRRNPFGGFSVKSIGTNLLDLGKGALFGLGGAAAGRFVNNMIPIGNESAVTRAVKAGLIAVAIQELGAGLVGRENAKLAAVGSLIGPVRDVVTELSPQAGALLSGYAGPMILPSFPGTRSLGTYAAYASGGGSEQDSNDDEIGMAGYADPWGG